MGHLGCMGHNCTGMLAARRQIHRQLPGAKTAEASSMGKQEKGLHARKAYSKGECQAYPQSIRKGSRIDYCCNRWLCTLNAC